MNKFEMRLAEEPFEKIQSGEKTWKCGSSTTKGKINRTGKAVRCACNRNPYN